MPKIYHYKRVLNEYNYLCNPIISQMFLHQIWHIQNEMQQQIQKVG